MSLKSLKIDGTETDEELVEKAQRGIEGDLRAFNLLLKRHKGRITSNCRSLSGSEIDAEDLAQEVFVKAYYGLSRYEGRSKFKTWLQRIKINHCLNHIRKLKGKHYVDIEDPAVTTASELQVDAAVEGDLSRADHRVLIQRVLESLPDSLRIPLVMCDMDGCSYQEIAESLELGLSAVKMRIKRGREEFRNRYERVAKRADDGAVADASPPSATL